MSRASDRIDGVGFELFRVRHTGTVEIEEEQAGALAIGDVVVSVNVGAVGDVQAKLDKDGVLARVAVLKQTETVVLGGDLEELKQILVDRLGLYGGCTMPPPVKIIPGERTPLQRQANVDVSVSYTPVESLREADAATGEVIPGWEELSTAHEEALSEDSLARARGDAEDEFSAWQARQTEVEEPADEIDDDDIAVLEGDGTVEVGHISDMTAGVPAEPSRRDGPRVVPMDQSPNEPERPVGQPIARIGSKDPVLASALQSEDGWS